LILLKVAHELGHAFVARAKGCSVPVMGIAMMLLAPMLYTETTDAWRLPRRRDRMLIDAAGVLVELGLAAVALLLWPFLPDGPARSAAFFVSSTAIVMSITVNASPFMRFDGYHLLADGLGMYNLGQRSFDLGRWHLRETLFGPGDSPPEFLSSRLTRGLIAYAYGTWIYRFSLFLGIAILIYHMFPKAISLPLFLIEVHMFILRPVLKEAVKWKAEGSRLFGTRRARITFLILAIVVLLGFLPLDRQVQVPSVLLPASEAQIFPPEAGEVIEILAARGAHVEQGDVLFRLAVPEIVHQRDLTELRLAIVRSRLARIAADAGDRAQFAILQREAAQLEQELAGLAARQERLTVKSPVSGVLTSLEDGLRPGAWIGASTLMAHVAAPEGAILAGLGAASDVPRLTRGAKAVFVAESGEGGSVPARLEDVSAPAAGIAFVYLSSLQGGPVAMEPDPRGGPPIPVNGVLPLRFVAEGAAPTRAIRGTSLVDANPQSFFGVMAARVAYVLLRESGF
jgi:putative peptide zinc metalloprotease protein